MKAVNFLSSVCCSRLRTVLLLTGAGCCRFALPKRLLDSTSPQSVYLNGSAIWRISHSKTIKGRGMGVGERRRWWGVGDRGVDRRDPSYKSTFILRMVSNKNKLMMGQKVFALSTKGRSRGNLSSVSRCLNVKAKYVE